jgi:hypothetical protein|tara:strand:+ start:433 stop:696 length:264 start_codon:yes stop_codon:yes gene_type:complete
MKTIIRSINMAMISSEALADDMGLTHKAVKKLILDFNIKGIPSGSSSMDAGKTQRMVLVDEDSFHGSLSGGVKSFKRKTRTVVKKKK